MDRQRKISEGNSIGLLSGYAEEFRRQLRTVVPATFERILYKIPWLLSVRVVGYSSDDVKELAGCALANTIFNVMGISIGFGLCAALTTLVGQAKGLCSEKNIKGYRQVLLKANGATASCSPKIESESELKLLCEDEMNYVNESISYDSIDEKQRMLSLEKPPAVLSKIDSMSQKPCYSNLIVDTTTRKSIPNYSLSCVYLCRGISIQLFFAMPMGVFWLMKGRVTSLLVRLGQDPAVSSLTEDYLRILVPGLWAYSVHVAASTCLQAMEMAHVPALAVAVGVAAHVPSIYLFVYCLDMGYRGAAFAYVVFQTVQPLFLLCWYLWFRKRGDTRTAIVDEVNGVGTPSVGDGIISDVGDKEYNTASGGGNCAKSGEASLAFTSICCPGSFTLKRKHHSHEQQTYHNCAKNALPMNDECGCVTSPPSETVRLISRWIQLVQKAMCAPRGIMQYLALALPGLVLISEWWASEFAVFLSGHLPTQNGSKDPALSLDAMAIYQSINILCFSLSQGWSVSGSTRVGNLLGEGNPDGAKTAAFVSTTSTACITGLVGFVLYSTPHELFPSLFTPDPDVIAETAKTVQWLVFYVIADGLAMVLTGIVKGCGRQCLIMPIVIVAYWIVGIPLGYYLSFGMLHINKDENSSGGWGGDFWYDNFSGDVVGLVAGLTTGTWVHMLLLLFVVCTINWSAETQKAQTRMQLEHCKS